MLFERAVCARERTIALEITSKSINIWLIFFVHLHTHTHTHIKSRRRLPQPMFSACRFNSANYGQHRIIQMYRECHFIMRIICDMINNQPSSMFYRWILLKIWQHTLYVISCCRRLKFFFRGKRSISLSFHQNIFA